MESGRSWQIIYKIMSAKTIDILIINSKQVIQGSGFSIKLTAVSERLRLNNI